MKIHHLYFYFRCTNIDFVFRPKPESQKYTFWRRRLLRVPCQSESDVLQYYMETKCKSSNFTFPIRNNLIRHVYRHYLCIFSMHIYSYLVFLLYWIQSLSVMIPIRIAYFQYIYLGEINPNG